MELILAIVVVLAVGTYFIIKRADKNGDGKIDAAEVAAVKKEVKAAVSEAKTVARKTATKARAAAGTAKAAVRKSTGKKPAAKK